MHHIAIDIGGRESQICVLSSVGELKLEKRMPTTKLKRFFAEIAPSRVILETCAEAFALAGQAKEAGHDVRVVPATLVRALGVGHRGIKTDQRDARCLAEASVRMDLGSVHIPSEFSRDLKAACGMREGMVASRTGLINGVRGWLRGELLSFRRCDTSVFPERIREYCSANKIEIPSYVSRQLNAIEQLTAEIKRADKELDDIANHSEDCKATDEYPRCGYANGDSISCRRRRIATISRSSPPGVLFRTHSGRELELGHKTPHLADQGGLEEGAVASCSGCMERLSDATKRSHGALDEANHEKTRDQNCDCRLEPKIGGNYVRGLARWHLLQSVAGFDSSRGKPSSRQLQQPGREHSRSRESR